MTQVETGSSEPAASPQRVSTGVPGLDSLLGGGLLPGTLTVVVGATGCGKTQLGLQFCQAGERQDGHRGIILDMACRGDSQSHAGYSERLLARPLHVIDSAVAPLLDDFFAADRRYGDLLGVFDYQGRRVTRRDMDQEAWRTWQAEIARKLAATIAFFYGNFTRGVRRAVIDGVEPVERASESIQLDLFEYIYHQIIRKDPEWVARDLFRQDYLKNAAAAAASGYDTGRISCLLLYTCGEAMLDELLGKRIEEGDVLANANTVIYLGRVREGSRIRRALYIPKHRGSRCSSDIVPYEIGESGVVVGSME